MSYGLLTLHSHSALERELRFPKHTVLVDEKFGYMFTIKKPFVHNRINYFEVPTINFVQNGGVFKNLAE